MPSFTSFVWTRRFRLVAASSFASLILLTWLVPISYAMDSSAGDRVGSDSVGVPGAVSLFDGQFSLPVSILIPPGRAHTTPKVQLVYGSAGSDGPFGMGWSLPIGSIGIDASQGTPMCVGGAQALEYSLLLPAGTHDLIEVSPGLYRPKTDNSFLEAELDSANNIWTVRDRGGMRYTFGAQPETPSVPTARVFVGSDVTLDASSCNYTTRWALTRVTDPVGNSIEYHYDKVGNFLYPSEILYGGNLEVSPAVAHPFRISFDRQTRPRMQTKFPLGARVELGEVVDTIDVEWRSSPSGSFQLLRTYTLSYSHKSGGAVALLETLSGTDLPTRTFEYSGDVTLHGKVDIP